jgi:predicted RNA-binding Zn ribbon-like protein
MAQHHLPPLRIVRHAFTAADLCAGHAVLDFVNTAAGLNRDPRDWLDSYGALLDWAALSGLFDASLLSVLATRSHKVPRKADVALAGARKLRDALYALVHHHREAIAAPISAVETLQHWCRRAGGAMTLTPMADGVLQPSLEHCGLDAIAASIALSAANLFSRPLSGRFGVCQGHNCGWVFLDTSPSRRRRWCDMKTCGNAAKASRHYRRSRTELPASD